MILDTFYMSIFIKAIIFTIYSKSVTKCLPEVSNLQNLLHWAQLHFEVVAGLLSVSPEIILYKTLIFFVYALQYLNFSKHIGSTRVV